MIHSLETDYERAERDALVAFARPGDVLFDVGAYVGWYSVDFAKRVPESMVYAFEPISENRKELVLNTAIYNNIVTYPVGLSNHGGFVNFYVSGKESGTASMSQLEEERFGTTMVTSHLVTTLDTHCARRTGPSFIKIDVEGAELLVLQGAIETLSQHRPIVLCEMLRKWSARFSYHPNDIIAFMAGLDYRCQTVDGRPFELMTNETIERNFFFLPTSTGEGRRQSILKKSTIG